MPRLRPVPARELIKILNSVGFNVIRRKGSHVTLKRDNGIAITIPIHRKPLGVGIIRRILRDIGMKPGAFLELLEKER